MLQFGDVCGIVVKISTENAGKTMYNRVYVEITNICNRNCSFCHGHSRPLGRMSMEEFETILDKLAGYTRYLYYHLMGEPFTHPQLGEFIRRAGQRGFKSIITTNGTLLDESILAAGIHKINLSIHSFEEGTPEDHRRYLQKLADFAKAAAEAGTIISFRLWNKGFEEEKNQVALQVLQEEIPGDWLPNTRGLRIRDRIFVELGERFEWPDIHASVQGTKFYCHGMKDQFGILVDGTVVPCCLDSDGVINLGNIFTEDLQSILTSKKARDMLEGFQCGRASQELCKKCGYAQRFVG